MGVSPRVSAYEVTYVFTAGRWDIDRTRAYLPIEAARTFFNRDGVADEIEVMLDDPDAAPTGPRPLEAAGPGILAWTWQDSSGAFLSALTVEDTSCS